jgi:hypothetical protein
MIGHIFTCEKAVEAAELKAWSKSPEQWAGYVQNEIITTWLGTMLGTIIASNTYRNNFGARIRSIRVRGTNGVTYYGRFGSDWSQHCRLRRAKL